MSGEKCSTCSGFGMWAWAIGDDVPMGELDAQDGYPTQPCPECGANANPPPTQPQEGTQETLTASEELRALYPANVHRLEYGLYDAWLSAVGPSARVGHDERPFADEVPESMKLPIKMRGKGIPTTDNKPQQKRGRKKQ